MNPFLRSLCQIQHGVIHKSLKPKIEWQKYRQIKVRYLYIKIYNRLTKGQATGSIKGQIKRWNDRWQDKGQGKTDERANGRTQVRTDKGEMTGLI